MPEDMALSVYEQVDVLVRWSVARYDALLAGTLLKNARIIVRYAAIFGAMEKEGFARTVRVRAHDLGANDLGVHVTKPQPSDRSWPRER